ncbi:hypothetical protein [Armatimonas sp.]|uniref:hypothetical protein n=1 Tax=Armatimonas sp. TaxID=1872638 RepID=UPI00286B412F|nr:hypothetical protein [Armatimonas sp.]
MRYFPKESEATLLEALDDPWPRVRRSARLLLQDTQNLLSPDFRFQFHLSTFLSHIPDVGHVKPETLSIREQAAFWEAVGKARFPSALPSLIATLANFDQSTVVEAVGPWFKTIEYSELRTDLQEAVQSFGDKAVPFLITTLLSYPKTPDLLFHALAQMDTHIAKQALFSFQETDLKQKALYWIAWRQRWLARRAKKPKLLATSSFSTITTPLSQMDFEFCSRMIFDIRSRHVHHSIAALKFEVNPEVGVLFWVLADDPAHSRQLRQLAHNGLEFWRRYNGRGKR